MIIYNSFLFKICGYMINIIKKYLVKIMDYGQKLQVLKN